MIQQNEDGKAEDIKQLKYFQELCVYARTGTQDGRGFKINGSQAKVHLRNITYAYRTMHNKSTNSVYDNSTLEDPSDFITWLFKLHDKFLGKNLCPSECTFEIQCPNCNKISTERGCKDFDIDLVTPSMSIFPFLPNVAILPSLRIWQSEQLVCCVTNIHIIPNIGTFNIHPCSAKNSIQIYHMDSL